MEMGRLRLTSLFLGVALLGALPGSAFASTPPSSPTGATASAAPSSTLHEGASPALVSAAAVSVSAGYDHACALLTGGSVRCWGDNWDGQLGDGTMMDSSSTPVAASGISTATAISAGDNHTCALLTGGTVRRRATTTPAPS